MKQGIKLEFRECRIVSAIRSGAGRHVAATLLVGGALFSGLASAQDADPAPPPAAAAPAESTPAESTPVAAPAETTPVVESASGAAPAAATDEAPTVAADAVAADGDIAEVLVTARRREESAQSVPIAVSVLGANALEDHHVDDIEDLQNVVPTLSVSAASGRPNAPVYSLRGIRPTEAIYGQDPTVAVYFDDVVLSPAQGSNLGMYDLASVQVLKGPQGTLFGRNTTGGALLLTPKRPGRTFGGDLMVGYGSYGRDETQFGIDMPLADNFALRLSGRTIDSTGYQTNVAPGPLHGDKLGGENTRSARLSAVWNITDKIENYTVVSWDHKSTNGRGMVLQAANPTGFYLKCYDGPTNPNGACFDGDNLASIYDAVDRAQGRDVNKVESDHRQFDNSRAVGVITTTTVQLGGDMTLKSIAGYRDFSSSLYIDLDASPVPGLLDSQQSSALKHASYELQLLGTAFADRLDWVTGLYWYYEDGYESSPGDTYLGTPAFDVTAGGNPFMQRGAVHNNSYSAFAQGSYKLTDKLSLTAGVRMTRDDKDMTLSTHRPNTCQLNDPNSDPTAPTKLPLDHCSVKLSDSFKQPTGTVSLDYKLRPDVMLYVASRYGYRAGGFNLRATNAVEYQPFDPETVLDAEVGAKTDWALADWHMRSNVAVYHQWYDDIQRTVAASNPDGTPGSAVQNAAKAKVFGLELEQTIAPTRHLSLQLNYAYVLPKYGSWTDPRTGADQSKTPFYFTPKHSGSATLAYTQPLDGDVGALTYTATASYKGDQWISPLLTRTTIDATPDNIKPLLQQDAYWLLDMSASWLNVMGSKFDVTAYMKNVTDREYAVGGLQLYNTFGVLARAYGDPRTYGMQLRYRF